MKDPDSKCIFCRGAAADKELDRVQVWEDSYWRLTASLSSETPGFCYLEPKRHIPYVTDLDGVEAASFGAVMARVATVLRDVTGAEAVYVYIFGDSIPHFHVHLAPHTKGDALNEQFIRGPLIEEKLPSGMVRVTSKEFPALPQEQLQRVARRIEERLQT